MKQILKSFEKLSHARYLAIVPVIFMLTILFAFQVFASNSTDDRIRQTEESQRRSELHLRIHISGLSEQFLFANSLYTFDSKPVITLLSKSKFDEILGNDGILFKSGYGTPHKKYDSVGDPSFASISDLVSFIDQNLVFPQEAKQLGYSAIVFVRFLVEADGKITNPELARITLISPDEKSLNEIEKENIAKFFEEPALDLTTKLPAMRPAYRYHNIVFQTDSDGERTGRRASVRSEKDQIPVQSVACVRLVYLQ